MRASKLTFRTIVTLLAFMLCQLGCGRSDSGLLSIFKTDAQIRAAGVSQGVVVQKTNKRNDLDGSSSVGCFNEFDIRLSSGTYGQFLTNYQSEVVKTLTSKGASIDTYEAPPAGLDAAEGVFRYLFTQSQTKGIVRVIWGTYDTNHYAMTVVFSEFVK